MHLVGFCLASFCTMGIRPVSRRVKADSMFFTHSQNQCLIAKANSFQVSHFLMSMVSFRILFQSFLRKSCCQVFFQGALHSLHCRPRYSTRDSLDMRIYKTDIQFWVVLGSQGDREKKVQTDISMVLLRSVFFMFSWPDFVLNLLENILMFALKSYIALKWENINFFLESILFWVEIS